MSAAVVGQALPSLPLLMILRNYEHRHRDTSAPVPLIKVGRPLRDHMPPLARMYTPLPSYVHLTVLPPNMRRP